ncbi:TRZ/ATZ family hydrolase [Methylophilaceae bacterium]|jgi:5-methylthioadenosine/S-adenosylhomocysteine deaminase|nr:TRZ/ATZ family hydrolase [Methylophilaceae bacterium]|tara:strand:- start:4362 stop:5690 length:1329 start_codon:yes stop_codon:yes gene_type:complete
MKDIKKNASVIISASWIFTAGPEDQLLSDYAVVIENDKVIDLLPQNKVFDEYEANNNYQLTDHILIPGLINTHTHAAMSLFKGFADDLSLQDWLNNHIWPAEKEFVNSSFVKDGSILALSEMIKSGVTTFNDMYFFPEATAEAVKELGVRSNIGLVVLDFPTNYATDPEDYLVKGFEFRDKWRNEELITTSIAPHAPYSVSNEAFTLINTYSEELNINIHTHLHETQWEIDQSIDKYGITPVQRLNNLGIIGPSLMAAHCVYLNDQDMDILAKNKVSIAHNPSSNMKLGSGIADVAKMLKQNLTVSLGTDSSASNNRLDIMGEMRLAALLIKGTTKSPELIPAKEAIKMATINGAKTLGLDSTIGSIEKNKKADLVAIDLSAIENQPLYNPISTLVYSSSRTDVSYVWIDGKIKLKDKKLVNIDEERIIQMAKKWQRKLKKI